jgi:hypothetical protein
VPPVGFRKLTTDRAQMRSTIRWKVARDGTRGIGIAGNTASSDSVNHSSVPVVPLHPFLVRWAPPSRSSLIYSVDPVEYLADNLSQQMIDAEAKIGALI